MLALSLSCSGDLAAIEVEQGQPAATTAAGGRPVLESLFVLFQFGSSFGGTTATYLSASFTLSVRLSLSCGSPALRVVSNSRTAIFLGVSFERTHTHSYVVWCALAPRIVCTRSRSVRNCRGAQLVYTSKVYTNSQSPQNFSPVGLS